MTEANTTTGSSMINGSNGWRAETRIDLGLTRRHDSKDLNMPLILVISTAKAVNGGIYTSANVQAEGGGVVTFEVAGDFSKTLERDRKARCTEKAVRAMHARVMARQDEIVAEAHDFYTKKAAKAA